MSNAWIIFALLTAAGTTMVGLYAWRRRRAHRKLIADNDARAIAAGRALKERGRHATPPMGSRTFGQAHPQAPPPRMPTRAEPLPPLPPLPDEDDDKAE